MTKQNRGFGTGSKHTLGQLERMSKARQEREDMPPRRQPSLPRVKFLERGLNEEDEERKP